MHRKFDYSLPFETEAEALDWARRYRSIYPVDGYGTRTTVTVCDTATHPYGIPQGKWYVFASRFLTAE